MATKVITPFSEPKYTQFDNDLIEYIMPRVSSSAWKILTWTIRQTWGWKDEGSPTRRKQWDQISYSQFRKATGIKSDTTVSRALDECLKAGYLLRRQIGEQQYEYRLNTTLEIEVDDTSTENEEVEPETSTENEEVEPETSTESVDTKERKKKEKKEERKGADAPPLDFPDPQSADIPHSGAEAKERIQRAAIESEKVGPQALARAFEDEFTYNIRLHKMNRLDLKRLIEAGARPADIPAFRKWWHENDWRGKQGEPPTPGQAFEKWPRFTEWRDNGKDSYAAHSRQPTEAEEIRAYAVRRWEEEQARRLQQ